MRFVGFCKDMTCGPRYFAALMDDRTLASRLLKLLLPVISAAAVALQLPPERLPEGVNWMFASDLVAALSSRGLHHAMLDWVAETDNASLFSLLKAAAKLMADCGTRAGSVLEALQAGLWQLHTAGCRLAHWAAAGGLQPWKQERAECLTTLCCRIGALVALQKRVWAAGLQCSTAAGFAAAYTRCAPLLRTGCCVGWMDAAVLALRCIVLHWPSTDCTIQRGAALH